MLRGAAPAGLDAGADDYLAKPVGTGEVHLAATSDSGRALVEVRDTGVGMTPAEVRGW